MAYEKLRALCVRMGYPGITPEAITEIADVLPEVAQITEALTALHMQIAETPSTEAVGTLRRALNLRGATE